MTPKKNRSYWEQVPPVKSLRTPRGPRTPGWETLLYMTEAGGGSSSRMAPDTKLVHGQKTDNSQ